MSNSVSIDESAPPSKKPHVDEWDETKLLGLIKRMEVYPKSTAAKEIAEEMDKWISPSTARLFSKALKTAKFAFDKDKSCSKAILPLIEVYLHLFIHIIHITF